MSFLFTAWSVVMFSASPADTLRLAEVYTLLAERSPELRAAGAAVRAAQARVGPVTRLPDPQVQFATMNRRLDGLGLDPILGMNQVTVMQMVPLGGRIGLTADAARAGARASEARLPERALALRARAARAFFALYRIDRSIGVIEESRDLVRHLARSAEAMYGVGEGRQADVLRAQVEVARMTEDLVRMEAMRNAEAARLNALLDRPASEAVPAVALPGLDVPLPSGDTLVARALASRPMLHAAAEDVAAAAALERRAGREYWPELTVGATYGQRPMDEGTDRMLSLMVGASVPIWGGRRQSQMRLEASAMREMAEAELAGMKAETRAAVIETRAELERVGRLATLYEGTVLPQAAATVRASQAAWQAGTVDFMTVLESQMMVNRYRLELIALAAERGTMLAELEMLTGQSWIRLEGGAP